MASVFWGHLGRVKATAISGSSFFFSPLVLSVVSQMLLPESPGVLIPDNGRSCRESRGSRFVTFFSVDLLLSVTCPLLSLDLETKP